jgi:2-polyprenyl-3-methyl-5-hydroxy-6-metoxy-1,4-benzoquinol methylase
MKFLLLNPSYLHVYFYLLHSILHWQEREDAILEIIKKSGIDTKKEKFRIVDFGCGPGMLVNAAIKNGFGYLGVDADPYSIDYSRQKYAEENANFLISKEPGSIAVNSKDIIVLNGVMHHLDDNTAQRLLSFFLPARLVIIADHYSESENSGLVQFLQNMDEENMLEIILISIR